MTRNQLKVSRSAAALIAFLALASLGDLGCSTVSKKFAGKGGGFQLAPFEEKRLANGLTVLFIPDQRLPYISYGLLLKSGAVQDPENLSGLSALTAEVIDKGTQKRSAVQLASDLGQLGTEFEAASSRETTQIALSGLSSQADVLLDTLVEIVTEPTFPDAEIVRAQKQVLAAIERRADNPEAMASRAFDALVYGTHPYGRSVSGTKSSVSQIKRKHVIQFYLRQYRPNNALLTVVGQLTPELRQKIETSFSRWEARDLKPESLGPVPETKGLQMTVVDKPGLVQAQIRIGGRGLERSNPDFLAVRLANTVLGGAFSSRLNDRIRAELGLTYGVHSDFDALSGKGAFEISTFTKNETVGKTVQETLTILEKFRAAGISDQELASARGYLKGTFPATIETPERLASNLMYLRFYGIPDAYLSGYLRNLDQFDAGEVNRIIKTYFEDRNLHIVVYGSASQIVSQLKPFEASHGARIEVKSFADYQ